MVTPVSPVEEIQADGTAAAWGVHEAAFTDVNADVAHASAGSKKDQIAS